MILRRSYVNLFLREINARRDSDHPVIRQKPHRVLKRPFPYRGPPLAINDQYNGSKKFLKFVGSPLPLRFGLNIRRNYHQKLRRTLFCSPDGSFSVKDVHDDIGDVWVSEHTYETVTRARLLAELSLRLEAYSERRGVPT